ncbi:MAG: DNA-directed RNA polymerase subunit M, partial [Desulfurococcaceae archaeon]
LMVRFCPRCGSIMYPFKKGDEVLLKCTKCGFETKAGDKEKYSMKYQVGSSKRTVTAKVSEAKESKITPEEREMLREYYEIFLEEFERSEFEESGED